MTSYFVNILWWSKFQIFLFLREKNDFGYDYQIDMIENERKLLFFRGTINESGSLWSKNMYTIG